MGISQALSLSTAVNGKLGASLQRSPASSVTAIFLCPLCPLVSLVLGALSLPSPVLAKDSSLGSEFGFLSLTYVSWFFWPQAHGPLEASRLFSRGQSNLVGLQLLHQFVPYQVPVRHDSVVQANPCNAPTQVTLALSAMITERAVLPVQSPKLPDNGNFLQGNFKNLIGL